MPRVGQEVLIDFLNADPDRPVVVGRVFTNLQKVPYALPKFRDVAGMRTESSPRMVMGGADGGAAASGEPSPLGGGVPMDAARIAKTLQSRGFGAWSPDKSAHMWSGNELTFTDKNGAERVYLQAQRDFSTLVKKNATAVIGDARSTKVGTDDVLVVDNKQNTKVAVDRTIAVGNDQRHTVGGSDYHFIRKNQVVKVDDNILMLSKATRINADEILILGVGSSKLILHPNYIVIQANDVFINPGEVEASDAAEGTRPKPQHEKDEAARKAKAALDARVKAQAGDDQAKQGSPHEIKTAKELYKSEAEKAARQWSAALQRGDRPGAAYWLLKQHGALHGGGFNGLETRAAAQRVLQSTVLPDGSRFTPHEINEAIARYMPRG